VIPAPRQTKDLIKERLARIEFANNNPCIPMVHFDNVVGKV